MLIVSSVTIMESKRLDDAPPVDELEETTARYKRRALMSNWSRYDLPNQHDDDFDDGTDYMIGEDFSEVIANQSKS